MQSTAESRYCLKGDAPYTLSVNCTLCAALHRRYELELANLEMVDVGISGETGGDQSEAGKPPKPPPAFPWVTVYTGFETSFTLNGLTEDTDYALRVSATNDIGRGPYSDTVLVTTLVDDIATLVPQVCALTSSRLLLSPPPTTSRHLPPPLASSSSRSSRPPPRPSRRRLLVAAVQLGAAAVRLLRHSVNGASHGGEV